MLNRGRKNIIISIKTSFGEFSSDDKEIVRTFNQYFNSIFSTSHRPTSIDQELTFIDSPISSKKNKQLMVIPSMNEIKEAIFSTGPLKALGPNRIPTMFYQKLWDIIGNDIIMLVQQSLKTIIIPEEINKTHSALIPKKRGIRIST